MDTKPKTKLLTADLSYARYALALLMFVYVMNFLDRQIIYILMPLIKTEMSFSNLQTALLGGTSFAIFYTVLGIPFGRLADKSSRKIDCHRFSIMESVFRFDRICRRILDAFSVPRRCRRR